MDRRHAGAEPGPQPRLSPVVCLLMVIALALPIFAHGCHTGDHDDEPSLIPPSRDAESLR
jgi:hypothetical protein